MRVFKYLKNCHMEDRMVFVCLKEQYYLGITEEDFGIFLRKAFWNVQKFNGLLLELSFPLLEVFKWKIVCWRLLLKYRNSEILDS